MRQQRSPQTVEARLADEGAQRPVALVADDADVCWPQRFRNPLFDDIDLRSKGLVFAQRI